MAKTFGVSPAWARRLKQHRRERGDIIPRNGGGSRGRKIDRDRLGELVKQQPDATLLELRDRLGVSVSLWATCKVLRELKLTYKKSIHAADPFDSAQEDRPDVADRRAAWRVKQLGLDPKKLVFIDETWAKTNMMAEGWPSAPLAWTRQPG